MKEHKIMNYKHIIINERFYIANFLDLGWSIRKITKYLNNKINCRAKGKSYNYKLIKYIEDGINKTWSPEQIASRLHLDYKDDKSTKVGFRTIYRWMYKNTIAKDDVKKLRRKGKSLKQKETRGKFNSAKSIKNIHTNIRKRENIGYYELDTVVSSRRKSKAYLSNFIEIKSRFLMI